MQTMTGDSGSDGALRLAPTLDLAAAEEFLATMRARAVGDLPLELDASRVEVITLPGAQIILSAANGNRNLSVRRPSEAFVKAFVDLGLSWPGDQEPVAASEEPVADQFEGIVEGADADSLAGAAPDENVDRSNIDCETPPQTDAFGQQQTDAPQMS
jgi:hypothetical protein